MSADEVDVETAGSGGSDEFNDTATVASGKDEAPAPVDANVVANNIFVAPPPGPPPNAEPVEVPKIVTGVEKFKSSADPPAPTTRQAREKAGETDTTLVLNTISEKIQTQPPKIQRKGIDMMKRYARALRVGEPESGGCRKCIRSRKTKIALYCILAFFLFPIIAPFVMIGAGATLLLFLICCKCRRSNNDSVFVTMLALLFSSVAVLSVVNFAVGIKMWGRNSVSAVEILGPIVTYGVLVTSFVLAAQEFKGAEKVYKLNKKTRFEQRYSDEGASDGSYSEGTQQRLAQAIQEASDTLVLIMEERVKWTKKKHFIYSFLIPVVLAAFQALIPPVCRVVIGEYFAPPFYSCKTAADPTCGQHDKLLVWNGLYCMFAGTYLLVLFLSITVQMFLREDAMQEEFADLTSDESLVELESSEGRERFILKIKDSYHLTLWTNVRYRLQRNVGEACQAAGPFVAMSLGAIAIFLILMALRFVTNTGAVSADEFAVMSVYDIVVLAGFLFVLLNASVSLSKVPKQDSNFLLLAKQELLSYASVQKKNDRQDSLDTAEYISSLIDIIKMEGPPTVLGVPLTYKLRNLIIALALVMVITGLYLGARSYGGIRNVYSNVKTFDVNAAISSAQGAASSLGP